MKELEEGKDIGLIEDGVHDLMLNDARKLIDAEITSRLQKSQ